MSIYVILISLIALVSILGSRFVAVQGGKVFYKGKGLTEFISNTIELLIYIKKVSRHLRKIAEQYTFHFFVRVLYWLQLFVNRVYAFARNRFMKRTIPDKKAVSRFWEYLKEYKQEMDQEKKK
ncbi:MAG: hypothetical protein RI996_583 [Candidatus Parcubacteria bacterium]|jgi:hypothetical protein